jgi:hypothetical protein
LSCGLGLQVYYGAGPNHPMEPGSGLFVAEVCGRVAFANAKPDDGTWVGINLDLIWWGSESVVELDQHFVSFSQKCMSIARIYHCLCHKPEASLTPQVLQRSRPFSPFTIKSLNMLNGGAIHTKLIMLRNPIRNFINMRARHPFAARNKRRTVPEQLIHIFQVQTFRLRLEAPEEYGVEEVADDEDEVEFLMSVSANSRTSRIWRDVWLLTQPIEVIAMGVTWPIIVLKAKDVIAPHETPFKRIAVPKSSAGMAQLSGPLVMKKTVIYVSNTASLRQSTKLTKIEEPRKHDKSPMRTRVVGIGRVNLDNRSIDNERKAKKQTSKNLQRSPPQRVDSQNANSSTNKRNNRIHSLEQQRSAGRNTDLGKDLRAEILDSWYSCHLAAGLDCHY